jgi:hypothetical protein
MKMNFEAQYVNDNKDLEIEWHDLSPLLLLVGNCMLVVIIKPTLNSLAQEEHSAEESKPDQHYCNSQVVLLILPPFQTSENTQRRPEYLLLGVP